MVSNNSRHSDQHQHQHGTISRFFPTLDIGVEEMRKLKFPTIKVFFLSLIQGICALLAIVAQGILFAAKVNFAKEGSGIWCGIIFALAAYGGMRASDRPIRNFISLYLICSVLSMILSIPMMAISSTDYVNYARYDDGSNDRNIHKPLSYHLSELPTGRVYLSGGNRAHAGNVFTYNPATKEHRLVCDNSWNITGANVICRQLGYSDGALSSTIGSHFGQVPQHLSYSQLNCKGNEQQLDDCQHSNNDSCGPSKGAGVFCSVTKTPAFQLVNGNDAFEGNIFATNPTTGIFGPVCDDDFGIEEARVFCRELGFDHAKKFFTNSYFGKVPSTFAYTRVSCNRNHYDIESCYVKSDPSPSCTINNGAGVRCAYRAKPDPKIAPELNLVLLVVSITIFVSTLCSTFITCSVLRNVSTGNRDVDLASIVNHLEPQPVVHQPVVNQPEVCQSATVNKDAPPPNYDSLFVTDS